MKNTIIHPETGKILYRDVRPVEYTYKEQRIVVDQPGWFPLDKMTITEYFRRKTHELQIMYWTP